MKPLFLVSVGATIGMMATTVAMAETVTTKYGRPLLVESEMSVAACSDVAFRSETEAQSWHDALAGMRAHDRIVQASWNNALADKRVEERMVAAATSDCALTN